MNQATLICDNTYQDLLKETFCNKKNLQKVMSYWLAFNKTKRNVKYKHEIKLVQQNQNQNQNKNQNEKKTKGGPFKIDGEIQTTKIIYQLFLDILLLKPTLQIIGTTIHLFKNILYGIPVTKLSLNGIKYFEFFYNHSKDLFQTKNYGFCQNILKNSILSVPTISFEIRTGILFELHKNIIQHVKIFLTSPLRRQNYTKQQNKKYYIEYIREYSEQIKMVFLIIKNNQKPLYVYQNEKPNILRFLHHFHSQLTKLACNLSLQKDS